VLLAMGSWEQVKINWDVTAPTTGWSMSIVYLSGLVFGVLACGLLLLDLWKAITGRLSEDELVMVQESEEAVQLKQVLDDARQPDNTAGARP
jgi:TRAP-type C4-dicarboxylate transport system permease small subunit